MIDYGLFAAAYVMFHITHGIADYWFQTNWMAQGKSKPTLKEWFWPLTAHVLTYSILFTPALILLGVKPASFSFWGLWLSIALPHMFMDRRTFLNWFNKTTKGWGPPETDWEPFNEVKGIQQAVKVHVTIHMDQKFHYLCLGLTALYIAWR